MIPVSEFYNCLREKNIDFFCGVPDSLLKSFCAYVKDNTPKSHNIIAANEGNALSIAAGYHMATRKIAVVYMQNSGLGNIINPALSLTSPMVYGIPALIIIGWRGQPDKKDEPQHIHQGLVTLELLKTLGIEYSVLSSQDDTIEARKAIIMAYDYMQKHNQPYAIVIKKNAFAEYKLKEQIKNNYTLSREQAISIVAENIDEKDVIISTTGMSSRELFEFREKQGQSHKKDFLTVGSMGHACQIALGVAIGCPNKKVYCIDGDGAFLMHMGGLAISGQADVDNFVHIVINNGAHDSVGGQETVGHSIDMLAIAKACGYKLTLQAENQHEIIQAIKHAKSQKGVFIEIKVNKGNRKDLGRPTTTPLENKKAFMDYLGGNTDD